MVRRKVRTEPELNRGLPRITIHFCGHYNGGHYHKDGRILGSILGSTLRSPFLGKLPSLKLQNMSGGGIKLA